MLTGESTPASRQSGDEVFGATVNQEDRLEVEVRHVGPNPALARTVKLVAEASLASRSVQLATTPPLRRLTVSVSNYPGPMSAISDRNQEQLIKRIQGDPRIGGGKVVAATALMRVSIFVMMGAGVLGLIAGQVLIGDGILQVFAGMLLGYGAYLFILMRTMSEPRVIGVMAVLTEKKLLLLGSRRAGVVGDWKHDEIESLKLTRKGNILVMAKVAITPVGAKPISFFSSNRRLGQRLVEQFEEIHPGGS